MKKPMIRISMLLVLCMLLSFGVFRADVRAADKDISGSVEKLAYIDSNNKLVLRFASFSDTGYTYEVAGITGSVSADSCRVEVNLGSSFKYKTTFVLKVTDKKSKDYIKVSYYSGAGISGSVSGKDNKIQSTWTLNESHAKNDYTGYQLKAANVSGALKVNASKVSSSGSVRTLSASAGSVPAGEYTVYTVAVKSGAYGYGFGKNIKYVPKVTGFKLKPDTKRAMLTWTAVKGATGYNVYWKKPGSSAYSMLIKTKSAKYTKTGLTAGKKYSFKVQALYNDKKGDYSAEKTCKVPVVPGKVTGVEFTVNNHGELIVTWNLTKKADSYVVYAKPKGGSYSKLGTSKSKSYKLSKLDSKKTYSVKVYAKKGAYMSDKHSKAISINPAKYLKKNRQRILAKKVKGISYRNGKCIYTTKNYTKEIKEAYVNYENFKSKTKYMILTTLYTQETSIFQKSNGKWKMIRTFKIASGKYESRTPRGRHEIFKKESAWVHPTTKTMYVSHFYKKASYHARPKWRKRSGYPVKTLGKPISKACVRCPDKDAYFIYKSIPLRTFVRIK